ncbi:MAG: nucleoside triphosphate pyrophosphohydrolase [candidate division Zixibacteria bacterium]|nr:nucleoside triphosphate pyrophosphohydrolase [candidate division Zixibacteria bacterium]
MTDFKSKVLDRNVPPIERLTTLMAFLRSSEGCAWDRKQTHSSLLPYLIEEAYEVVEAVESGDFGALREELGDLLCQVVFHAQLASEAGYFVLDDSITQLVEKLIARHPHVFGDKKELSPQEVRDQWEQIKIESEEKKSVLGGIPRGMPALTMAYRIGEKAAGIGFDWKEATDVVEKLDEEITEIKEALAAGDTDQAIDEVGDLLFAASSLSRKLGTDPELVLKKALNKFHRRFERLEERVRQSGKRFQELSLEQLEAIWQEIK